MFKTEDVLISTYHQSGDIFGIRMSHAPTGQVLTYMSTAMGLSRPIKLRLLAQLQVLVEKYEREQSPTT